ncbi:MAG: hypothetical protein ACN23H_02040 [Candidatus Phytoplasma vitis]|nr:MAG: hypothetical protein M6G77_02285 [Candidatus Phytoplasma vitis]
MPSYNEEIKIKAINADLIKNKIITQSKKIQLGFYNVSPDTDLVISLPENNIFKNKKIEAVDFDDGIRFLQFSNGTKKIYFYTFEKDKKQESINITNAIKSFILSPLKKIKTIIVNKY